MTSGFYGKFLEKANLEQIINCSSNENGLKGTAGIYMIVWNFPESSEKVLNYQRSQWLKSAGILHGSM
jgi:hypothetical protein